MRLFLSFLLLALFVPSIAHAQTKDDGIPSLLLPGTVRVVTSIDDTKIRVPVFSIDPFTLEITIHHEKEPIESIIEEVFLSGSGFIVRPDGYIVTNAHVVSVESLQEDIMAQLLLYVLYLSSREVMDEYEWNMHLNAIMNDPIMWLRLERSLQVLMEHTVFDINSHVVVLDPSVSTNNIDEYIQTGFPATIVDINEEFAYDEKDIALLKISKQGLPALRLGDSGFLPSVGSSLYVAGFPASMDFDLRTLNSPTFTRGTVNVHRKSAQDDFTIIQTDAKISFGSSGGPAFHSERGVVGVITFMAGADHGDSFAFAIPVSLVYEVLERHGITPQRGDHVVHIENGLSLLEQKRCREAIQEFAESQKNINSTFSIAEHIRPHVETCQGIIERGESVDTEIGMWWKDLSTPERSFFAGGLSFSSLSFMGGIVFWTVGRRRERS
jgi:serine protease Do